MTERKIRKILLSSIPIETDRLVLRYIRTDDAYDMYEYASVPAVSEYLLWYPHINIAATEGYIESLQKRYLKGMYADWGIELKSNGKMIGTCGYAAINSSTKNCEIGYVLSPAYRHKGYMTEAVNAVLQLTFDVLMFESATLRIIAENKPSIRLAERIGFVFSHFSKLSIKDSERDVAYFIITKDEYKKMKQS